MDLQLELLPYHDYNTLGFGAELLDYLNLVDDSIVLDQVGPLYKEGGRRPVDPRTYFRMHDLYFTRPEITSFRQLCKQLVDPKNHAWRNFIGTPNIKDVPVLGVASHLLTTSLVVDLLQKYSISSLLCLSRINSVVFTWSCLLVLTPILSS
ncbi:hypothetical protein AJ85_18960 [Alkalihalobacillus alcalophilus ATCC 27647 = CGMCC 1.3604]|uniref:Transposase InsH N-terminal domain-containing protein n=1 Tax=Alkalihalobacillus alcalophilus ATCC 27647 = CGMCC 1.3604 TaxID=1218173 RepID=A0A094WSE4_ALKAL|nr:hypothetical protein [Alkalihalobacillus alcalophilus]KGA98988.1 hypothetical protein BALCAV_0201730 [Alkalihalobacillus alcalophilus ATCC 27647 = CGMCC 1.3604]MED1562032.1 hypothetical protein [Alkalihalobacillus alcalophilus]THG89191.1 hypothetical protein AJ85_18960 [Alkalihalobacillus alcalophilus ATCC 27647 = CGMCC 1.3604]